MKLISFLFVAIPALAAFLMFDQLVRIEYEGYRKHWEADGKPHGIFWVPSEARVGGWFVRWGSSVSSRRCAFSWLLSTPKWVPQDKSATRFLFWWRFLVGIWCVSFVLSIILFVYGWL